MKLELASLRVIGCGPLRDVCIDFRDASGKVRPVTVLGGANGSGKTTVLELIVELSAMLHPKVGGIGKTLAKAKYAQLDWLLDGNAFSIYRGVPPADATLPNSPGATIGRWRAYAQNAVVVERIRSLIIEQEAKALDYPDEQEVATPTSGFPLPSILYFPYYRILRPVSSEHIERETIPYSWIYRYPSVQSFRGSLDSYLIWLDYAEPEVFARVRDFLNSLDFGGKTFSINRKELKAIVNLPDGSQHYLEDLSSGEQNILIMLLELRRRLLPHSIVLIDEIENSLHPAFQHRLAQALLKMQQQIPFQLIVTTHAPAFVEIFGPESTLLLTEF